MKKKLKFNIIDFLICFVLILAAVLLFWKFSGELHSNLFSALKQSDIVITVKTAPIKKDYSDNISIGQPIMNHDDGTVIGRVSDIVLYNYESETEDKNDYIYAVLKIDSFAEARSGYYMINNEKILVNKVNSFSVPDLYFEGRIISIDSMVVNRNKTSAVE